MGRRVVRLWICGPTARRAGYAFIQALYLDNPHTAKEYGRQLEETSDRSLKQRLKDGNWDYDEDLD